MKFWTDFIKMHLTHNLDGLVKDSIKNFHFKGLNYICFQFNDKLTIRLYIVKPEDNLKTESVNIHNHLYDSQILMLSGEMQNNVYREVEGDKFYSYYLTSALNPDNKTGSVQLEPLGKVGLEKVKSIRLRSGDSHLQVHSEIHNVVNSPNEYLAFMVFEYPTVKSNSILYTTTDFGGEIPTKKGVCGNYTK